MRPLASISLIALILVTSTVEAAPCQEPNLGSVASDHPECRFYKGTRHFRAKEYTAALQEWIGVVDTNDMPKEFEHLRISAQNNLGYLYYSGLGVPRNSELAIQQYWLPAEKSGHEEAAYHLCHAYAAANSKLAFGYCREALRRYERLGEADADKEVVEQLRRQVTRLEGK